MDIAMDIQMMAAVEDAEAYQRLLDLAADANAAEGVRHGLDDMTSGRTRSARKVFEELRDERGIPRRRYASGGARFEASNINAERGLRLTLDPRHHRDRTKREQLRW